MKLMQWATISIQKTKQKTQNTDGLKNTRVHDTNKHSFVKLVSGGFFFLTGCNTKSMSFNFFKNGFKLPKFFFPNVGLELHHPYTGSY